MKYWLLIGLKEILAATKARYEFKTVAVCQNKKVAYSYQF